MPTMWTDELQTAHLTICAMWVVATYSLCFGDTPRQRAGIAVAMTVYLNAILLIAASESISTMLVFGTPAIGFFVGVPIAVLTTYFTMTSHGVRRAKGAPMDAIVIVHALRVLGAWFIVAYNRKHLPAPFAPAAGWGDILAGARVQPPSVLIVQAC